MKQKAKPFVIGICILLMVGGLIAGHLHPVPYDRVAQWCPVSEKQIVIASVLIAAIITAIEEFLEAYKRRKN